MLKASGYSIITDPGTARPIEHDTYTCAHCGAITFTRPGLGQPLQVAVVTTEGSVAMREVTRCFKCWEFVCPRCEGKDCTPRFKAIEIEEAQSRKIII